MKHISKKEMYYSSTAIRLGINNTPTLEHFKKLDLLGLLIFEPIRTHFNVPIKINSMYRCPELNKAIGGSRTSQHCLCEAIDIDDTLGGLTNKEIFYFIVNNLDFDQLIWEFGTSKNPAWVHISYKVYNEEKNRKKITISYTKNNKVKYASFYNLEDFEFFKVNL